MCILEIKLLENFVVPLGGHTFGQNPLMPSLFLQLLLAH